MMSPMDFYSSITPDCSIHPGAGSGIYEEISEERLPRTRLDKSPYESSVLNVIGQNGLISYNDYSFLLALLATPVRFIETAFNVFDVTGDGNIDAKVGNIMTRRQNKRFHNLLITGRSSPTSSLVCRTRWEATAATLTLIRPICWPPTPA